MNARSRPFIESSLDGLPFRRLVDDMSLFHRFSDGSQALADERQLAAIDAHELLAARGALSERPALDLHALRSALQDRGSI